MHRESIIDIVMFGIVTLLVVGALGYWSYQRNAMLYDIMECMPDGSRASYDACYQELYGGSTEYLD